MKESVRKAPKITLTTHPLTWCGSHMMMDPTPM
jgi:hypothetical protein